MITYHLPMILSSSDKSGALNKAPNGSSFQVSLEKGLLVPRRAKYCWLTVQSAEVWNTSPNVITGVNDRFPINDSAGALEIIIPKGLYDISLLNQEINRQIVASGRPSGSIEVIGNNATQKTFIKVVEVGTQIDFTGPNVINELLGFEPQLYVSVVANQLLEGQNVASFNNIDYFVLHTDIVSHGLRVNNKYTQAVAQVLVDAPTGSQILHQPDNPPEIPCPELIGTKKNLINVWLTDQDNNRVETSGENFSMRLVVYYVM